MEKHTVKIPAKLNLSLAITGIRDGLHTLDMIVCPYEKYADEVCFIPQTSGATGIIETEIKSKLSGFDKNRFLAVLQEKIDAIAKKTGVSGKLIIYKNIPLGAGMGGSSASVVGALLAIENHCKSIGKNTALDTRFLLSLGSDVPYMYTGGVCRVKGVGEIVEPLNCQIETRFETVIAKGGADSGDCYRVFDKLGLDYANKPIPTTVEEALEINRNDLFEASCIVNPNIKTEVERLKSGGIDKVYMTGSGSGLFFVKEK